MLGVLPGATREPPPTAGVPFEVHRRSSMATHTITWRGERYGFENAAVIAMRGDTITYTKQSGTADVIIDVEAGLFDSRATQFALTSLNPSSSRTIPSDAETREYGFGKAPLIDGGPMNGTITVSTKTE
jgi:hypothetical protein